MFISTKRERESHTWDICSFVYPTQDVYLVIYLNIKYLMPFNGALLDNTCVTFSSFVRPITSHCAVLFY